MHRDHEGLITRKRIRRAKKQKSRTLEYFAYAIALIVVGWAIYSLLQPTQNPPPQAYVLEGEPAPDFLLSIVDENGLSGARLTLSELKGKTVLLEFMASWCPHCQNMVPTIEKLRQEYGTLGVTMVSVAATWQGANVASTAQFIQAHKATWLHVIDEKNAVFDRYGVSSVPYYFLIDPSGIVKFRFGGEQTYSVLAETIDRVLKP